MKRERKDQDNGSVCVSLFIVCVCVSLSTVWRFVRRWWMALESIDGAALVSRID